MPSLKNKSPTSSKSQLNKFKSSFLLQLDFRWNLKAGRRLTRDRVVFCVSAGENQELKRLQDQTRKSGDIEVYCKTWKCSSTQSHAEKHDEEVNWKGSTVNVKRGQSSGKRGIWSVYDVFMPLPCHTPKILFKFSGKVTLSYGWKQLGKQSKHLVVQERVWWHWDRNMHGLIWLLRSGLNFLNDLIIINLQITINCQH